MKNWYAAAAILGGILWLAITYALVAAWERGSAFPTYEFLNALRPLPLALFAFALYGLYRSVNVGRTGLYLSLAGFALLAAGAALEFWIGGGVRDGDVDTLSLAGWLTYLVGFLVLSIGLLWFGVVVYRAGAWGGTSILPLLTGIVWAAWFPLVMVDEALQIQLSNSSQYIFALLWVVMGVVMLRGTRTGLKWQV